jgi:Pyrimidine dimer DNA glycosylase
LRLWTLHPRYLDSRGLVALWREALLAQAVLRGRTQGYRRHPQLARFRGCDSPRAAINAYLLAVHDEAARRGYLFDRSKIRRCECEPIVVTRGQLLYEWNRLLTKLRERDPALYRAHRPISHPLAHPLFRVTAGPVAGWEKLTRA